MDAPILRDILALLKVRVHTENEIVAVLNSEGWEIEPRLVRGALQTLERRGHSVRIQVGLWQAKKWQFRQCLAAALILALLSVPCQAQQLGKRGCAVASGGFWALRE